MRLSLMKILVVDDDSALRLSISKALMAEGHEVVEAEDGEKAVALISLDRGFDAVFLDVNMPRMSGIDALQNIKEISPETCG
jgi:CheY-like chemotaxis protein